MTQQKLSVCKSKLLHSLFSFSREGAANGESKRFLQTGDFVAMIYKVSALIVCWESTKYY